MLGLASQNNSFIDYSFVVWNIFKLVEKIATKSEDYKKNTSKVEEEESLTECMNCGIFSIKN